MHHSICGGQIHNEGTMKHLLCLVVLAVFVPVALFAGRAGAPQPATLVVTNCNISVSQPCLLVTGSGYAGSKSVTIEVEGATTNETFTAPADRKGNIALYIYQAFAPGSYTVISIYPGTTKALATAGFEVQ